MDSWATHNDSGQGGESPQHLVTNRLQTAKRGSFSGNQLEQQDQVSFARMAAVGVESAEHLERGQDSEDGDVNEHGPAVPVKLDFKGVGQEPSQQNIGAQGTH